MKLTQQIAISLILLSSAGIPIAAHGQVTVARNSTFVSVGAGFQGNRFHASTWRPSGYALAEYAIMKNVTLGLTGNYYGEKIARNSHFDSYSVGLRGSYYVNSLLKREARKMAYYAGVGVLYYNYKYSDFAATKGRIYVPVHVGAKRLFSRKSGATVELGFNDMSFLKVGVFAVL